MEQPSPNVCSTCTFTDYTWRHRLTVSRLRLRFGSWIFCPNQVDGGGGILGIRGCTGKHPHFKCKIIKTSSFKHPYFLYICGFWIRSEQKSGRIHTFAAISLNKMTFLNALIPFSIRIPRKLWVSGVCVLPKNKKKKATTDGACVVHTFGLSANVRRPRDKRKSCTHMSIRGYDVYESF